MTTPRIRDAAAIGRTLALPALPTAPRQARAFVNQSLTEWHVKTGDIETTELLVSELVTNAVKQTGCTNGAVGTDSRGHLNEIRLWVRRIHAGVIIAVWDNDLTPPILKQQSPDAETGRGLHLVATLSECWSYYFPEVGGKVIWCQIDAP